MFKKMLKRIFRVTVQSTLYLGLVLPLIAFAEEEATAATNAVAIDTVWTLVAAFLVFFMQPGF
ncbi:ammonium transporter, partial [bacterium]|nr:ammonium transporter [bacterium]